MHALILLSAIWHNFGYCSRYFMLFKTNFSNEEHHCLENMHNIVKNYLSLFLRWDFRYINAAVHIGVHDRRMGYGTLTLIFFILQENILKFFPIYLNLLFVSFKYFRWFQSSEKKMQWTWQNIPTGIRSIFLHTDDDFMRGTNVLANYIGLHRLQWPLLKDIFSLAILWQRL